MSSQPASDPEPVPETSVPSTWERPDPRGGPVDDPAPLDLPALLAEILAVDLSAAPSVRLARLSGLGAVEAALHALRLITIASLSPVVEDDYWEERHVVEELRLALGVSERHAGGLLDQARAVHGGHPRPVEVAFDPETGRPIPVDTAQATAGTGEPEVTGPAEQPEAVASAAPFAVMGTLLAAGLSSPGHLRVLAAVTANVTDDPAPLPGAPEPVAGARPWRSREDKLTEIATRSRRAAARSGVVDYRRTVRRYLLIVDGEEQAGRAAVADAGRGVVLYPGEDGQGRIAADGPMLRSRQLYTALNDHAKGLQNARGGVAAARRGVLDARISACRYDALHALVTGIPATRPEAEVVVPADNSNPSDQLASVPGAQVVAPDDNCPTPPGVPVEVLPGMPVAPTVTTAPESRPRLDGQLVIDVRTLAGLAEHPGLLDGEPIPAAMARALALDVVAWRRLITDPLTGHLLDYGTRQYTPDPLWRWVKARDGGCTAPGCNRGLYRSEVDHRIPYPVGGSDRDNTGMLCTTGGHHQLKTHGWISVTDSHADGSMTWHTKWGQQIRTSPSVHLPGFDEWIEHQDGLPPEPPPPPAPTRPRPAPDPDEKPPF